MRTRVHTRVHTRVRTRVHTHVHTRGHATKVSEALIVRFCEGEFRRANSDGYQAIDRREFRAYVASMHWWMRKSLLRRAAPPLSHPSFMGFRQ